MTRFALRGLLSRKLRTALTAIAIVLGVGMISGTFVLTDSISHAFDRIFTDARKGSDAVISGKSAFDLTSNGNTNAPPFDESLLPKVRALPDVKAAIEAHVEKINENFARVEQVKKIAILSHDLSQESGELTPTLKVKRAVVAQKHEGAIEQLYAA